MFYKADNVFRWMKETYESSQELTVAHNYISDGATILPVLPFMYERIIEYRGSLDPPHNYEKEKLDDLFYGGNRPVILVKDTRLEYISPFVNQRYRVFQDALDPNKLARYFLSRPVFNLLNLQGLQPPTGVKAGVDLMRGVIRFEYNGRPFLVSSIQIYNQRFPKIRVSEG